MVAVDPAYLEEFQRELETAIISGVFSVGVRIRMTEESPKYHAEEIWCSVTHRNGVDGVKNLETGSVKFTTIGDHLLYITATSGHTLNHWIIDNITGKTFGRNVYPCYETIPNKQKYSTSVVTPKVLRATDSNYLSNLLFDKRSVSELDAVPQENTIYLISVQNYPILPVTTRVEYRQSLLLNMQWYGCAKQLTGDKCSTSIKNKTVKRKKATDKSYRPKPVRPYVPKLSSIRPASHKPEVALSPASSSSTGDGELSLSPKSSPRSVSPRSLPLSDDNDGFERDTYDTLMEEEPVASSSQ